MARPLGLLTRFWRRFRLRVVARLAVVVGAFVGAALLARADGGAVALSASVVGAAVLAGLGLWAAAGLIRMVEKPARDLRRFLEGIRYDDMSGHFPASHGDPLLDGLAQAFESVGQAFRTVRAEREEQAGYLEAVVRHVGVSLIAFRADGDVTLFNLAAGRTLGVARPRSLETLGQRAPDAARALARLATGERTLIRLDQEDGTQELVAYATRFTVAGETHTLVSLQDIRQELEARELEAWQQLTRVLTHEITNSVAPISSLAATASALHASGTRADDVQEALGTIERRSRGLISFVDSYRTLAKLPAPTARVIPAAELLGDIALLARAKSPAVTVEVEVDPPSLELVADPDLIEQALVNLALNAVEALDGRPHGRVTLRAFVGTAGRGVLEVADDGPGVLPEVAERVFLPFFSTKPGGSGIGLALSHRIARLHGGTLSVASVPDVETTFTLRL